MKNLLIFFLVLFSIHAMAGLDDLVGTYKAKSGTTAQVTKKLVTPANLFEPAVYSYLVKLQDDDSQLYLDDTLDVDPKKNTLSLYIERECDDPGCYYFNDINVFITKLANKKTTMSVSYSGLKYEDDDQPERDFEGEIELIKVK